MIRKSGGKAGLIFIVHNKYKTAVEVLIHFFNPVFVNDQRL